MNNDLFLVIEILGEPTFHKTLNQSGYSGRDYQFFYNSLTRSHLRAYRDLEVYRAERVDMHKAANVWPLIPNLLEAERIEAQCWTKSAPGSERAPGGAVGPGANFSGETPSSAGETPALPGGGVRSRGSLEATGFRDLRGIAKEMGIVKHELNKGELIEAILREQEAAVC